MPYKSRALRNAWMRIHNKERYHKRRAEAVAQLGGKCVRCGVTEHLEIDHIDRTKKSFSFGPTIGGCPPAKLQAELAKCQLLCAKCHSAKSVHERGLLLGSETHGTNGSYKQCHCDVCREAHNARMRAWRQKRRDLASTLPRVA